MTDFPASDLPDSAGHALSTKWGAWYASLIWTVALPVSFLSDFGHLDEFVGVVHGVIYRLSPDSRIIDITHGIPAGDVRAGALALTRAIQYLPPGVVLAVVDPGVGTARRAIAAATEFGFFVGPDNGLLSPAVAMMGGAHSINSIENPEVMIPGSRCHVPGKGSVRSGRRSARFGRGRTRRSRSGGRSGFGDASDAPAPQSRAQHGDRVRRGGSMSTATSKPTSGPTI